MKVIMAKIIDSIHPKLSQPIQVSRGKLIQISIPDDGEEDRLWQEAAKKHFLEFYEAKDAIYDEI